MNSWWLRLWRWFVLCDWQRNTLLSGVGLFVLLYTPVFNIVFGFLWAGSVNGTDWTLPWSATMIAYLGVGIYIIDSARQKGLYPSSPYIQQVRHDLIMKELRKRRRREAYARRMALKRQAQLSTAEKQFTKLSARRSRPIAAALAASTALSYRLRTALRRFATGG